MTDSSQPTTMTDIDLVETGIIIKDEETNNDSSADGGISIPVEEEEEKSVPVISCCTGMINDLKIRLPLVGDDWSQPTNVIRVFNATFYAFVVQLIPALIFAEVLDRQTEGNLAVAETLLAAGIIGIIYAVLAGQPLTVLGITGPTSLLLGTSYGLASQFDADYFSFFWWVLMWSALMHIGAAMLGLVNFVWSITPFTTQIFEFFIGVSFCFESLRDLVNPVKLAQEEVVVTTGTTEDMMLLSSSTSSDEERSSAYANLLIGICTFYICWTLHFAETWPNFTEGIRDILTSYNMMIALIIMTALSYLPGVDQDGHLERVNIRETSYDWQPTSYIPRPWLTNPLEGIDTRGILAAIFPGFMFFALFFIDHNVSSIMAQSPKYNLKKPPAYHWDFFVLGLTMIPCALLGIPPGNGLIPQAPLHVRALCKRERKEVDGIIREVYSDCQEQRWSAFFQAALMFVALSMLVVVSWIPVGCLFGIFLYLGVVALYGNEIMERILMCTVSSETRPRTIIVENVNWQTTQLYTFVQAGCGLTIFAVGHFTTVGYIFPALVAALCPVRIYLVNWMFTQRDLKFLDPFAETLTNLRPQDNNDDDDDDDNNAAAADSSWTEDNESGDEPSSQTKRKTKKNGISKITLNPQETTLTDMDDSTRPVAGATSPH